MRMLKSGMTLCLALASLASLSACRKDVPPAIDICIGDGHGGADCVLKDNTRIYRAPSELQNYWMTTQQDMLLYSSWCYRVDPPTVQAEMTRIRMEAQAQ